MRALLIAALSATLVLSGCSGNDNGDHHSPDSSEARPVRGEIKVDIEPMALADLPEAGEAGTGVAVLGEQRYSFAVTFCDGELAVGSGDGEGMTVAWDVRDDGDHRVAIRLLDNDERWVRAGDAEGEWDPETRTVRFAGAFVPFRADSGEDARPGGLVAVCPDAADAPEDAAGGDEATESAEEGA